MRRAGGRRGPAATPRLAPPATQDRVAAPSGPAEGESEPDELAAWALARALAMPHNAELLGAALEQAWPATHSADPSAWSATLRDQLHSAAAQQPGWRVGRGALGRRAGAVEILITLLERWGRAGAADAVRRLAGLKPGAAVELLRIPQRLGPARSRQLLADAIYPAALALGEPPDRSRNAGSACPRRATCAPTHYAIGSARTTHTTRTARCAGVTAKLRRCSSSNAAGAARAPAPSVRSAASIAPTDLRRAR